MTKDEALAQPEQELCTTLKASIHAGLDKKNDNKTQVDHQGKQPEQEPMANYCKECLTYNGHHEGCSHYTTPPQRKD